MTFVSDSAGSVKRFGPDRPCYDLGAVAFSSDLDALGLPATNKAYAVEVSETAYIPIVRPCITTRPSLEIRNATRIPTLSIKELSLSSVGSNVRDEGSGLIRKGRQITFPKVLMPA